MTFIIYSGNLIQLCQLAIFTWTNISDHISRNVNADYEGEHGESYSGNWGGKKKMRKEK